MTPVYPNIDIKAALAEAEGLYRERNPKSLVQHHEACAAMPGAIPARRSMSIRFR